MYVYGLAVGTCCGPVGVALDVVVDVLEGVVLVLVVDVLEEVDVLEVEALDVATLEAELEAELEAVLDKEAEEETVDAACPASAGAT